MGPLNGSTSPKSTKFIDVRTAIEYLSMYFKNSVKVAHSYPSSSGSHRFIYNERNLEVKDAELSIKSILSGFEAVKISVLPSSVSVDIMNA